MTHTHCQLQLQKNPNLYKLFMYRTYLANRRRSRINGDQFLKQYKVPWHRLYRGLGLCSPRKYFRFTLQGF